MDDKLSKKNNERVINLAEVFTPQNIVKDMINLISDINYSSKFFEPGCGTGNFLIEVLNIKLNDLLKMNEVKNSLKTGYFDEFEHKVIISISSIYGVDIDESNVNKCIERLYETVKLFYCKHTKSDLDIDFDKSISRILNKNIINADLLSDNSLIHIFEYSEMPSYKVKIRKFNFFDMIYPDDEVFTENLKLFPHIPKPIEEYDVIFYNKIHEKL